MGMGELTLRPGHPPSPACDSGPSAGTGVCSIRISGPIGGGSASQAAGAANATECARTTLARRGGTRWPCDAKNGTSSLPQTCVPRMPISLVTRSMRLRVAVSSGRSDKGSNVRYALLAAPTHILYCARFMLVHRRDSVRSRNAAVCCAGRGRATALSEQRLLHRGATRVDEQRATHRVRHGRLVGSHFDCPPRQLEEKEQSRVNVSAAVLVV